MIRINLLEGAAPTEWEGKPEETSPAFGVEVFAGALLAAAVVVGVLYWVLDRQVTKLSQQLEAEKREAARLAAIQAQNLRYQDELMDIHRRIAAIQELQDSRQGPSQLMTVLGTAVTRAPGLYLLSVAPKDQRLVINGASGSVAAIADFVTALGTVASFQDVNLHEYFEDDQQGRINFKFSLDCVYNPGGPLPQVPTKEARPGPSRAARGT